MKKALILIFLVLLAGIVYAEDPEFDCKALGITLDKCYNQGGIFKAEFTIKGATLPESHGKIIDVIRGIEYTFDTNKKYTTINNDIVARGGMPVNYKLNKLGGDKYSLEINMGDNEVNSLRVAYSKDDLYKYTHEMEYCYLESSKLGINMYGFKVCESVASEETTPVVENKVTAKVIEDITPIKEKSNTIYYILGGILFLSVVLFFVFRKKKTAE